jgi:hypothetical protein
VHVEDEREVDIPFDVESSMEMGEVQGLLARDLHWLTQSLDAPRVVANDSKQAALLSSTSASASTAASGMLHVATRPLASKVNEWRKKSNAVPTNSCARASAVPTMPNQSTPSRAIGNIAVVAKNSIYASPQGPDCDTIWVAPASLKR